MTGPVPARARAGGLSLVKLPVAAVQGYAVTLVGSGLVNLAYPVDWLLFRDHPAGAKLSPLVAVIPLAFGGNFSIYTWPGT